LRPHASFALQTIKRDNRLIFATNFTHLNFYQQLPMANSLYKIVRKRLIACKSGKKNFIAKHFEGGNINIIKKNSQISFAFGFPTLK
jgi:hypothetical protein